MMLLVYIHPYTEFTSPSSHSLAPPVPLKTSLVWATPVLHPVEEVLVLMIRWQGQSHLLRGGSAERIRAELWSQAI